MMTDGVEVSEHLNHELDDLLAQQPDVVRDAAQDAEEYFRLMRALVAARRVTGRQKDVARVMGTTQSAISDLENVRTDPQISTLLRYARAVGLRVRLVASGAGAVSAAGLKRWERPVPPQPLPRIGKGPDPGPVEPVGVDKWRRSA